MKKRSSIILALILVILSFTAKAENLPEGAIQKGSLSNHKLINDTMIGVSEKVSALGCNKPQSFLPYVLVMPEGKPGSRYWEELWVVKGCESEYPVKIMFSESDLSSADYIIED